MISTRIAPNQILTHLSLEAAREATWRCFAEAGLQHVVIDVQQNTVTGWTAASFFGGEGQNVITTFAATPSGTIITVDSTPQWSIVPELGQSRRHAARLLDDLAQRVTGGSEHEPAELSAPAVPTFSPIAAPTGEFTRKPVPSTPIYAPTGPWPRGGVVMTYGLLGLFCCPFFAPFAIWFGIQALLNYRQNDLGDKPAVLVGLILGLLGLLAPSSWVLFMVSQSR